MICSPNCYLDPKGPFLVRIRSPSWLRFSFSKRDLLSRSFSVGLSCYNAWLLGVCTLFRGSCFYLRAHLASRARPIRFFDLRINKKVASWEKVRPSRPVSLPRCRRLGCRTSPVSMSGVCIDMPTGLPIGSRSTALLLYWVISSTRSRKLYLWPRPAIGYYV